MRHDEFFWRPAPDEMRSTRLAEFLRIEGLPDIQTLRAKADADPRWFWDAVFRHFAFPFPVPYSEVLNTDRGNQWPIWCVGGRTNLSFACLERHLTTPVAKKTAIISVEEDDSVRTWTYAKLEDEAGRLAAVLKARGIKPGDVVGLYMPMILETAAAFFAIIKCGAIVLPLFSGYGPASISERLELAEAKAVIVVDVALRRGVRISMKQTVDEAISSVRAPVIQIVLIRSNTSSLTNETDIDWNRETRSIAQPLKSELMDAESPAMLMYTSGTTGAPKGTIHTHCGMLAKNALDVLLCLDLSASDRLLWMSDMGWVIGPKSLISSLMAGATLVMAEGSPDWPMPGRFAKLIQDHAVTFFGIVPTVVRQLMRTAPDAITRYDLSTLRATVSSGEPWNEDSWIWFFEHVCQRRIPILNYAGGTEIGGAILISTLHDPLKPCAFGGTVPGIGADIVDSEGQSLPPGIAGELVLRKPSIGLTRGLWNDPQRYIESYWSRFPDLWVQGDYARRDSDGLWYLLGRSDDTIKIAGKRTGPAELESILAQSGLVVEVAIVGIPDETTGSALACVAVSGSSNSSEEEIAAQLAELLASQAGPPFRPRLFVFVDALPKTRNQKVMRRLVRSALVGGDLGDTGSLINPASINAIRRARRITPQRLRR